MGNIKPEPYFYLASPYSHPDEEVRKQRERSISDIGAKLTHLGLNLFCPITQSHRLNEFLDKGQQLGHDECMRVDYALLDKAEALIVAKLSGWDKSVGVKLEMDYAREKGMMIYTIDIVDEGKHNPTPSHSQWEEMREDVDYIKFQHSIPPKGISNARKQYNEYVDKIQNETGWTPSIGFIEEPVDKYGEPRDNTNKETIVSNEKGASKAGKPSIMNFPWGAYKYEELPGYMDDIIENKENHDKLRGLLYKLFCVLMKLGTTHMQINEVFEAGLAKHGLRTHRNYTVSDIDLIINALGRHILKDRLVERDEESGLSHKAHAGANILMLMQILNLGGKTNEYN